MTNLYSRLLLITLFCLTGSSLAQESYAKFWIEIDGAFQGVDGSGLGSFDVTRPLAETSTAGQRVTVAQLGLGWDNTNLNGYGAKIGVALAPEFSFALGYTVFESKSFTQNEQTSDFDINAYSDYTRRTLNLQIEVSPPLRWMYLSGGMEMAFSDLDYRSIIDASTIITNERFESAETNAKNFDTGFYGGFGLKILDNKIIPNLAIVTQASLIFSTLSTELDDEIGDGGESTITMDGVRFDIGLRYGLR
ncbi:MAG: hypothetical protein ACRBF0_22940 [Calditrichia bacterium]